MYQISKAIYEDMATHLREAIGSSSYYSGVEEFSLADNNDCEVLCRVIASLIIYRHTEKLPYGIEEVISNIIPVWIECHTFVETEEIINDFDMDELKSYICVC